MCIGKKNIVNQLCIGKKKIVNPNVAANFFCISAVHDAFFNFFCGLGRAAQGLVGLSKSHSSQALESTRINSTRLAKLNRVPLGNFKVTRLAETSRVELSTFP